MTDVPEHERWRAWAVLFARLVLGLIFFMAGAFKVFELGPAGHVERWFLPYADTFLPMWALWAVGVTVPFVELVGGALLIAGWLARPSAVALGCVIVVVTFGHLVADPLYPFHEHVIPRLALVLFILVSPPAWDRFSIDRRRRETRAPPV